MGITQEQAVRDFIVEFECESLDASRIERVLNRMTPDIRDTEDKISVWRDYYDRKEVDAQLA